MFFNNIITTPFNSFYKETAKLFLPLPPLGKVFELGKRILIQFPYQAVALGGRILFNLTVYTFDNCCRSKQKLGIKVNNFFLSSAFKEKCNGLNANQISNYRSLALRLFGLARNQGETKLLTEMILKINPKEETTFLTFAIQFIEIIGKQKFDENPLDVAYLLANRLDYAFHGTAPYSLKEINKRGLSRLHKNLDAAEILEIDRIGREVIGSSFSSYSPWFPFFLREKTDEGDIKTIYLSRHPSNALSYATASPEWFSLFFDRITSSKDKKPWPERLKANLLRLQNPEKEDTIKRKMTAAEAEKVKNFTVKYFNRFRSEESVVLLVKTDNLFIDGIRDEFKAKVKNIGDALTIYNAKPDDRNSVMTALKGILCDLEFEVNKKVTHRDFAQEHLTIFKLPTPNLLRS